MPLCKEYYEMIARGEKPEEYREKKAYWICACTNGAKERASRWQQRG